jgi:uncharacterized membrane protein
VMLDTKLNKKYLTKLFIQFRQPKSVRRWELSNNESNIRSITKAVSYRLFGSLTTFIIAYIFTGSLTLATTVGVADLFGKIILFYLHERLWNKISWGRK